VTLFVDKSAESLLHFLRKDTLFLQESYEDKICLLPIL